MNSAWENDKTRLRRCSMMKMIHEHWRKEVENSKKLSEIRKGIWAGKGF